MKYTGNIWFPATVLKSPSIPPPPRLNDHQWPRRTPLLTGLCILMKRVHSCVHRRFWYCSPETIELDAVYDKKYKKDLYDNHLRKLIVHFVDGYDVSIAVGGLSSLSKSIFIDTQNESGTVVGVLQTLVHDLFQQIAKVSQNNSRLGNEKMMVDVQYPFYAHPRVLQSLES